MPALRVPDQWTPTRGGILFVNANRHPAALEFFALTTCRVSHVAEIRGNMFEWGLSPSASRDGTTVVYTEPAQPVGNIVLVNGYR